MNALDRLWLEELDRFCPRCDKEVRLCDCAGEEDGISCIDCGYFPCECEVGYGPIPDCDR